MSYKDTRIIDFIEFNPKLTLKKGTVARKIPMENLAPFTRDVYSNTYEPYNGGAKFQNKDTIVARITPSLENGKTAFINHLNKDEIAFGSTEFIVLRAISGVSYPQFVYYFSTSTLFRDNAIASMTGTSGRQRVQENTLYDLIYRLPSLDKQKAIANILSSLDDKIELNNKINKNLENLAQTLYKRWFVDFEFPNDDGEPYKSSGGEMVESELGLIPKGWIIENVTNLFVFKGGSQPPKEEHIYEHREGYVRFIQNRDYKEETRHLTFIKESPRNKTAEKLDILMDKYGEVGQIRYGIEGAYNVALAKIDPINSKNLELLRGYFSQDSIREYLSNSSIASTRGSLNATTFTGLKIAYTESEIKEAYSGFQTNILLKILKNKEENKRLSQIRDELLPKLMSGEIEVPIEE